jgi:hypothetical protein
MINSIALIPSAVGAAAIVPALLLLWLIVSVDRRPEHPGWIAIAFLGGAATAGVHVGPAQGFRKLRPGSRLPGAVAGCVTLMQRPAASGIVSRLTTPQSRSGHHAVIWRASVERGNHG